MSDDFTGKSNPELDAAINGCTSASELRERMLAVMAQQGTIVRSPNDEFDNRVIRQPEPVPTFDAPKVNASYGCERIFYLGNARIVLTGGSEADLDIQEAAIRGQR